MRQLLGEINETLSAKDHKIKGYNVRAGCEMTPARKPLFSNVYRATEALQRLGVHKSKYDMCSMALTVYSVPTVLLLGETCPATFAWKWQADALLLMGIQEPDLP